MVDERGPHPSLTRLSGWAPHEQRAAGAVPRTHGKKTTLLAALTPQGLQAPWTIEGAIEREALREAVSRAVAAITQDDAVGWFAHAGYPLPASSS